MAEQIPIECITGDVIMGCTYPNALNYNPLANYDDGSCIFPAVATGTTFEVNIFASHYLECDVSTRAGYYLHVPQITANESVSNFHMFIKLFAYNYTYDIGSFSSEIANNCGTSNYYTSEFITTIGDEDRFTGSPQRPQVLYFNSLNPNYVNAFTVYSGESNHFFGGAAGSEYIPVDIEIYADGVKYTGSGNVPMGIPDGSDSGRSISTFTVTVNQ